MFHRAVEIKLPFILTKTFRDLRVVHFRVLLCNLPALHPGPHHEGVHGSLDMIFLAAVLLLLRRTTGRAARGGGIGG